MARQCFVANIYGLLTVKLAAVTFGGCVLLRVLTELQTWIKKNSRQATAACRENNSFNLHKLGTRRM